MRLNCLSPGFGFRIPNFKMDNSDTIVNGETTILDVKPGEKNESNGRVVKAEKSHPRKCTFFVQKKNRSCRLMALKGSDFCGEHFESGDNLDRLGRTPCPYDPKHSCPIKMLEDHKMRCNMRPKPPMQYVMKGINSPPVELALIQERTLADLNGSELARLISMIHSVYKDKIPEIKSSIGSFDTMLDEINTPGFGHRAKRHLIQASSLLSYLKSENLMVPSTCFVELGSGRGLLTFHLAHGVQEYVPEPETCRFVLIDRESHRHKRDNKLKDSGITVERLRVDLADLAVGKVDSVNDCSYTVGYSKHLCGEAADMSLKCMLENNSRVDKVNGIVIANCCHNKCSWGNYVGKKYFLEWGFKAEDFRSIIGICSWAVCGTGTSGFDQKDTTGVDFTEMDKNWAPKHNLALNQAEKRSVGIWAKLILDYGRVLYIRSFGLNAYLSEYASRQDTLENIALIATRGAKQSESTDMIDVSSNLS